MHFKNTTGCSQLSVIAVGKNCSYYQKKLSPNEKLIRAHIRPASIFQMGLKRTQDVKALLFLKFQFAVDILGYLFPLFESLINSIPDVYTAIQS